MAGYTIYQPFLTPGGVPNLQNAAFNAGYYNQASFSAEPGRRLGIDTNSLSPHSSGSGHYSTQSSPLQPHPGDMTSSPTTASAKQTDFPAIPGLPGRSLYHQPPSPIGGQYDMMGIARPLPARQLSPVASNRALPVRKSDSSQLPRSPQIAVPEPAAESPPDHQAIEAARRGLATLRIRSRGGHSGARSCSPSSEKKEKRG